VKKILLVDDGSAYARAIADALNKRGYNVIAVPGGREGCDALVDGEIALVISDLHLPDLEGLTLHSYARQIRSHRETKFIFISAVKPLQATIPGLDEERDYFHDASKPVAVITSLVSRLLFGEFAGKWV
jgi:DNA-binding response OmpR family regulator